MASPASPSDRSSVIIVGAGISGVTAAKVLVENGVEDVLILEACDRIGGRLRHEKFGGISVELGAGWIVGVGGRDYNPALDLVNNAGLRTLFSDYSQARYNIYDRSGKIYPKEVAASAYAKMVEESERSERKQKAASDGSVAELTESQDTSSEEARTPLELAIDFILHDFEMPDGMPLSTFQDLGEKEFMVADEKGIVYFLYKMAAEFLSTSNSDSDSGVQIVDSRLKLNQVVREIQHSRDGVTVKTEDGSVYKANYLILSVSIGVLQSDLITFSPPLPRWKVEAIDKVDITVYTKIFIKFPYKFWPCGPGKEFFIYAHERRGYFTFWQHLENAFPGCNILVATLTNEESKRLEDQADEDTLKEAMSVLREMFGPGIPDATDILLPRWWKHRFQCCSYSNYPIADNSEFLKNIKAPIGEIHFTGEHTSEKFSGYIHGAYLEGIGTATTVLEEMRKAKERTCDSEV